MLRIATTEDLDLVHSMAMKFANTIELKDHVDEEKVKFIVYRFLSDEDKVVFLHGEKGFLAASMQLFLLSKDLLATEVAWWVEPAERGNNVGKELVEVFEKWAKEAGASIISMACYDDKVGEFYEKVGYRLSERSYIKEI